MSMVECQLVFWLGFGLVRAVDGSGFRLYRGVDKVNYSRSFPRAIYSHVRIY